MTSVSKNVYRGKLDDIVNKYNNVLTLVKKLIIKTQTLELVTLLEYQNVKTFLQKVMFQIGLKRFLWLKKLKTLFLGHVLLVTLKEKKLLEHFMKTSYNKQIKKMLELKK